jgi:ABC-2 type transport system permease protein
MNQKVRSFLALTKASMKMYYRNKGAIFFSLLFPLVLLAIFGFLSGGRSTSLRIGITNNAKSEISKDLVSSLKNLQAFRVIEVGEHEGLIDLSKGNLDLQIIVPERFGEINDGKPVESSIKTWFNKGKPQGGQIANLAVIQIVSALDRKFTNTTATLNVESEGISTNDLGYFDFILPGILSMTIMQLGIFGVAFSFVAMKASGALRRIQATPVHPIYFVFSQATVRMFVTLATAAILVGFGSYFFGFHMLGSYVTFAFVCILGILIFLGVGFGIAGWARDETQVAPVANIIQLPLLLLSGIFFPRDGFPSWLKTITDYFPLTYLSHGLRSIANEGAGLGQIYGDIIGMAVWIVVVYVVTARIFRWE